MGRVAGRREPDATASGDDQHDDDHPHITILADRAYVRGRVVAGVARRGLLDIEPTLARVAFITGSSLAAGYLGFAIPQAIGVAEATTIGVFAFLALPAPAALAFALARRGRMLTMGLVGVVLYGVSASRRTEGS